MNRTHSWLLLSLLTGGCVAAPRIAAPRPAAPPPPLIAPPAPAALGWTDAPVEAGTWRYAREGDGSAARFGVPGAVPAFEMRCDAATRTILLVRPALTAGTMTITTSYGARALPVAAHGAGVAVALAARDPLLDQIAFSRARFAIDAPGLSRLILPAWAEPTRVIEDCRS